MAPVEPAAAANAAWSGSPPALPASSAWRAWAYLVLLSWQRQARVRQMVAIALAVLAGITLLVGGRTLTRGWGMGTWRSWRWGWEQLGAVMDFRTRAVTAVQPHAAPGMLAVPTAQQALYQALLDRSPFLVFSMWVVFALFVSFLLPVLSLSFGTEALGGDRENQSLLWLLTRPLGRPAIYLAKFVALVPWVLALNVGGFALLCLAGGRPGRQALGLYWPAVACGSLAFAALFQLFGAYFRRPAVMALLYSFFLEVFLGNMPGYMKRVSLGFYTRCMMYEAAETLGVQPDNPTVYMPVSGPTAAAVLLGLTAVLVGLGMVVFSRQEYVAGE